MGVDIDEYGVYEEKWEIKYANDWLQTTFYHSRNKKTVQIRFEEFCFVLLPFLQLGCLHTHKKNVTRKHKTRFHARKAGFRPLEGRKMSSKVLGMRKIASYLPLISNSHHFRLKFSTWYFFRLSDFLSYPMLFSYWNIALSALTLRPLKKGFFSVTSEPLDSILHTQNRSM